MSSEPETEWMNVSFDFKFLRLTGLDLDDVDRVQLLSGLGKAIAYLLLPEDSYDSVRIFVKNLELKETQFLTDDVINKAIDRFFDEEGEEP